MLNVLTFVNEHSPSMPSPWQSLRDGCQPTPRPKKTRIHSRWSLPKLHRKKTETDGTASQEGEDEVATAQTRQRSISECYFAMKGAAHLLPQNECVNYRKASQNGGDIQQHLQSMFYLLRQEDTLKMAVKLESGHIGRTRYLVVVSCIGKQTTEESCLLGVDCNERTTIGLVLPVWADTRITLDGDGGFSVSTTDRHHIFKPVSVQAMWSALQTLHKASDKARECNYFKGGLTHSWLEHYEKKIQSDRSCLNEWHAMDNLESRRPPSPDCLSRLCPKERAVTEKDIREKLKEIMMTVDLDEVTSKYIRTRLEEVLDMDLNEYKSFIDQEMLTILGQMDKATEIFEYLYLGSEWNASNLEELQRNGVGHILNVTHEIDNFFPGMFDYLNIRVYDDEGTELLKHWDKTYKFITNAKDKGSKVLVHCKMGVSRSASVVIAYAMKAHNWNMQKAQGFVKDRRPCVKPNVGFMRQLEIYQGILGASKHRHNTLWRSKSENNLKMQPEDLRPETADMNSQPEEMQKPDSIYLETPTHINRPKSWSPDDNMADILFPQTTSDSPDAPSCTAETVVEQEHQQQPGSGTTVPTPKSKNHVLLQCSDAKSYSVSQNKALHLALPAEPVKFQIGDADDDSPVYECKNPVWVDGGEEVSQNEEGHPLPGSLPRVSSVKDRISELESAAQTAEPKVVSARERLDLPENMGIVLNLTNHFESVSKSNPSSPVEESSPVDGSPPPGSSPPISAILQGNGPVLSQTKLPALRHQAVLVRPEAWDGKQSPPEVVFCSTIVATEPKPTSDELIMRVRVNNQVKQMVAPPQGPDEGIMADAATTPQSDVRAAFFRGEDIRKPRSELPLRQNSYGSVEARSPPVLPSGRVHDPFSAQLDHVFDREEHLTSTDRGCPKVPARHDSWGSCDSAIGLQIPGQRDSPSRQSSWGSVESRGIQLSRECSWNSVDAPQRRPYCSTVGSVSPEAITNLFMMEQEPPTSWATGTVKRSKAAPESDCCLKRTNSYDDALPLHAESVSPDGSFPTAAEPSAGYLIQRSQSLRTNTSSKRPFLKGVQAKSGVPNFTLHGPKPYRNPAENPPVSQVVAVFPTPHYASTPVLYKSTVAENVAPGPLHSASHPNITFSPRPNLPSESAAALLHHATDPPIVANGQHPTSDKVPCTGIVRQQKEVLESMIASLPSRPVDAVYVTAAACPTVATTALSTTVVALQSPTAAAAPPPPERKSSSTEEWKRLQQTLRMLESRPATKTVTALQSEAEDGVVKRITREMEAKGVSTGIVIAPTLLTPVDGGAMQEVCDKVIILDQHGKVFDPPTTPSPTVSGTVVPVAEPSAAVALHSGTNPVEDKSVKSLVGRFEPPLRPRHFSETEVSSSPPGPSTCTALPVIPPTVRTSGGSATAPLRSHQMASVKNDQCGGGKTSSGPHRLRSCNSWNGTATARPPKETSGTVTAPKCPQNLEQSASRNPTSSGPVTSFVSSTSRPPPAMRSSGGGTTVHEPAGPASALPTAAVANAAQRKIRKLQAGKSHPLSKLTCKQRHLSTLYNTM